MGLDINANHVRAVSEGIVVGTARPLHLGRGTQVWEIRIENEKGQLVCISRLTLAVVPRQVAEALAHECRRDAPYAALGPDVLLDAVAAAGFEPDGRLLALASYENRVYQVGIEEGRRWSPSSIAPAAGATRRSTRNMHSPRSLNRPSCRSSRRWSSTDVSLLDYGVSASRFIRAAADARRNLNRPTISRGWGGCSRASTASARADTLSRSRPGSMSILLCVEPARAVLASGLLPTRLPTVIARIDARSPTLFEQRFAVGAERATFRLHGDCHGGNVLWTDAGPHFVDLDDARIGHCGAGSVDARAIAAGAGCAARRLCGVSRFQLRANCALIEPLRIMRQIHGPAGSRSAGTIRRFRSRSRTSAKRAGGSSTCNDLAEAQRS